MDDSLRQESDAQQALVSESNFGWFAIIGYTVDPLLIDLKRHVHRRKILVNKRNQQIDQVFLDRALQMKSCMDLRMREQGSPGSCRGNV